MPLLYANRRTNKDSETRHRLCTNVQQLVVGWQVLLKYIRLATFLDPQSKDSAPGVECARTLSLNGNDKNAAFAIGKLVAGLFVG